MKTTVAHILDKKGHRVETIDATDNVYNAIKKMADHNIGALVVVDSGRVVGIVTERHYSRNVFLKGKSSRDTPVRDIMETDFAFATLDDTNRECMAMMTKQRTRHLPVMEGDDLKGILSIGDLVKSIMSEQELTIQQLEHYIHHG